MISNLSMRCHGISQLPSDLPAKQHEICFSGVLSADKLINLTALSLRDAFGPRTLSSVRVPSRSEVFLVVPDDEVEQPDVFLVLSCWPVGSRSSSISVETTSSNMAATPWPVYAETTYERRTSLLFCDKKLSIIDCVTCRSTWQLLIFIARQLYALYNVFASRCWDEGCALSASDNADNDYFCLNDILITGR